MNVNKTNTSNTLIVLGAIVAAGAAYWFFFSGSGNQPTLTNVATSTASQVQFDALAGELGQISFDTSIFSDPRFKALIDFSAPTTSEPKGRADPFAPIPGVSGSGG